MLGVVIILVVLFLAIPIGVLVSGGVFSGILGTLLKSDVEASNEGSELIDLNV